ncbi:hypothetical protein CEUSTIGMA_g8080.t1 [Chlamydomonas eustigma]|uniref:Uncharacterized protein n=1 Tax=Chlamydomonas eustigma TaxID=1157962 RepID=A0A250XC27_9CHLO|nr:hypothetical protein CEUSTIGMA_g8080.t1 [Chlamydomonas eustigma]|eukprot:GAX80645.1 hypothetical protein CEUSTIGMA_g8080.t1 [Chlamydomonas eustigma]
MQSSIRCSGASSSVSTSTRSSKALLARPIPFTSKTVAPGRTSSVKVYAKKGQKGRVGMIPGQGEMVKVDPPTPDVDAENVEFVIFVRATNYIDEKMKVAMKASPWVPLTIVKGSQAANFLVKTLENKWGRLLYAKTLIRQIGQAVYKDRDQIERNMKQNQPSLRTVPSSNFQYAFKIRDKTQPRDWYKSEGLTMFPPEEQLKGTALDEVKAFFSTENISKLFAAQS